MPGSKSSIGLQKASLPKPVVKALPLLADTHRSGRLIHEVYSGWSQRRKVRDDICQGIEAETAF
jgi:hypothetical protein